LQAPTAYTRGMKNTGIVFVVIAVIAFVIWLSINQMIYFEDGTIRPKLLALLVLAPLAVGLIVGFGLGWSRGRVSIRSKT
jgi:hypothetical protein